MSSVRKGNLIVSSYILLALMLYFFSGFLPVAGAITGQELAVEYDEKINVTDVNEKTEVSPDLSEIMAQRPASVEGLIDKGNTLYSLKKYQLSMNCYNEALKIDSNSSLAWYGKGRSLAELGKNAEAVNCYHQALLTFPVSSENWYDKGNKQLELKKYVEAVNCYDKSFAADTYLATVWYRN